MPDFNKQSIATTENDKSAKAQTIALANFKKNRRYVLSSVFCMTLLIFSAE